MRRLSVSLSLLLLGASAATARDGRFAPDWGAISTWPYPLTANGWSNPVLTRYDIVGQPALYVADPFLWHDENGWYLFFELYNYIGKIALARSENGIDWTFDQVILSPGFHVSYPCVFQDGDDHYMVVEAGATQSVPLYRATNFPYEWTQVGVFASGRAFADPTILRRGDTWWLFVSRSTNDVCYLYYADSLSGGWTEHPQSPVVVGSWCARPAGHMVALSPGRLLRVAQDCNPTYGEGVRVFEVDALTRDTYAEHQIPESPVLFRSGAGWNARGMHTCDLWWRDGVWIAAVDGMAENGLWSIGFYWGRGSPGSSVLTALDDPWRVRPNPFRAGDEVRVAAAVRSSEPCDLLEIFDPAGRLLRTIPAGETEGPAEFRWSSGPGFQVEPGLYLLRASSRGRVLWRGKGIAVR